MIFIDDFIEVSGCYGIFFLPILFCYVFPFEFFEGNVAHFSVKKRVTSASPHRIVSAKKKNLSDFF